MSGPDLHTHVVDALEKLAIVGTQFTTSQLRRELGILPKGKDDVALWNFWRSLVAVGAVEELPAGRRRNRIFRVSHPERLRVFANSAPPAETYLVGRRELAARVVDLEHRVTRLELILQRAGKSLAG